MPEKVELLKTKTISINESFPIVIDIGELTRGKIHLDITKDNLTVFWFENVSGVQRIEVKCD